MTASYTTLKLEKSELEKSEPEKSELDKSALLGKPIVSYSKGVFNPTLQEENSKLTSHCQLHVAQLSILHLQLPASPRAPAPVCAKPLTG